MADVTHLGLTSRTRGTFKYRTLPQILAEEQLAFAARMRAKDRLTMESDLKAASVEERMGASLLRVLLNHMDVVVEDSEASIVRMVLPTAFMEELAMWGADREDSECGCDLEQWDFAHARA